MAYILKKHKFAKKVRSSEGTPYPSKNKKQKSQMTTWGDPLLLEIIFKEDLKAGLGGVVHQSEPVLHIFTDGGLQNCASSHGMLKKVQHGLNQARISAFLQLKLE